MTRPGGFDLGSRRVLVTGHTGFVGSWLCLALREAGAEVAGFSRSGSGGLFSQMGLDNEVPALAGDVLDSRDWDRAMDRFAPEAVLHLAAYAHKEQGAASPLECIEGNVMGLVRLLEACQRASGVLAVAVAGSEAAYRGRGRLDESAPLGGQGAYGASKAAMEMVVSAMIPDFAPGIGLASLRFCNIIGGGDRAKGRIAPNCLEAFEAGKPFCPRTPGAILGWLHVVDAVRAWLMAVSALLSGRAEAGGPMNIGSGADGMRSVAELADALAGAWAGARVVYPPDAPVPGDAPRLLDTSRAEKVFGWSPVLDFNQAVSETVRWHRRIMDGRDPAIVSREQIGRLMPELSPESSPQPAPAQDAKTSDHREG